MHEMHRYRDRQKPGWVFCQQRHVILLSTETFYNFVNRGMVSPHSTTGVQACVRVHVCVRVCVRVHVCVCACMSCQQSLQLHDSTKSGAS